MLVFLSVESRSCVGGVCVQIESRTDAFDDELGKDGHQIANHRHLTECTYKNGTAGGFKCSARGACDGLSSTFIANNIGCGTCVSYLLLQSLSLLTELSHISTSFVNVEWVWGVCGVDR